MRIKEIILTFAIVIVLNLVFNYGIFTFYDEPDYGKSCPSLVNQKTDKQSCESIGGEWQEYKELGSEGELLKGSCNAPTKCYESYNDMRDVYERNVFVILIALGIASFVVGFLVIQVTPVANGLLGGGLLSLIIGSARYWTNMDDYLRFTILSIALVILIWLGYKKLNKSN